MESRKRKALEAAGWKVGDAADFVGLTEHERQVQQARLALVMAIRRQREAAGMTQKQLAAILKTSQPRVVRIEHGMPDVSLDQLVAAFTAAGGMLTVKEGKAKTPKQQRLTVEVATAK